MKMLESKEDLLAWDKFREFTKETLKLVGDDDKCYISKDKLDFQIDGKSWKGHAVLAGKKGELAMKKLKPKGVIFRETTVQKQGKDLAIGEIKPPKLRKEAEKLFLKLRLGYKVRVDEGAEAEGSESQSEAAPGAQKAMPPGERAKKLDQLKKMEGDIDKLIKALDKS